MLRVNTKPRKRNSPRIAEKSALGYLQWLRGRECRVAGCYCHGKIEAAHVDHAGGKGMGTKVADRFANPLCTAHHRMQHLKGWREFEDDHGMNAVNDALAYWSKWPGRIAWERKLDQ